MSVNNPTSCGRTREAEHPLARAFASFTEAAGSLERTYGQLQAQVTHLREELEVTNRDLALSVEENRRIRERLRRIVETLPCGVLVMETGGGISTLNPAAARLLGGNFETAETLPRELSQGLERARQTGQELELVLAATNAQQAPCWLAMGHAWLERAPGRETSVFILRDVSEAKKLESDREQLRRRQALVEMSALLAHEIRNPLGSLELFAGLLAEAHLEGESRRWIEHVQAGLRTLSATVNNVLHLHNAPQPELAATDAGELLDWAYGFLLPLARQARVGLQVVNGLRGVAIRADRHRLEQVILNLALNAFRFMPGGGWLSLRGGTLPKAGLALEVAQGNEVQEENELSEADQAHQDRGAGAVEIEVRDTGTGIAVEDLPRIFEAGFSTRPGSSGLGLAVCRGIVEQHGGGIAVESEPGRGAAFRLWLPLPAQPPQAQAPNAPDAPPEAPMEDASLEDAAAHDAPMGAGVDR